jgi:hypothetical protein
LWLWVVASRPLRRYKEWATRPRITAIKSGPPAKVETPTGNLVALSELGSVPSVPEFPPNFLPSPNFLALKNTFPRLANVELNTDVPPTINPFSDPIFLAVRTNDLQIAIVEPCDAGIAKTDVRKKHTFTRKS